MDDFNVIESLPTIITPKNKNISLNEFIQILANQTMEIKKLLLKHGVVLFRNFPIHSSDDFTKVIKTLQLGDLVNYIGGDSPRTKVKNKIYTSTETPPSLLLPLHNELSYVKHYPKHIYFYCDIEPINGGVTTIADARKVYNDLDTSLIKRFQENGLTYISRYHYNNKLLKLLNRSHKSWVDVFETNNKIDVDKICKENEIIYRWLKNDWIEMKETRSATLEHPITKQHVWFNQAHLFNFNPRLLGYLKYWGTKLFYFQKTTRLHEITFANGRKIPKEDLYHILETLEKNTVSNPWKKGDIMVLDNILAMHGRAPFKGKRRILTALTK